MTFLTQREVVFHRSHSLCTSEATQAEAWLMIVRLIWTQSVPGMEPSVFESRILSVVCTVSGVIALR